MTARLWCTRPHHEQRAAQVRRHGHAVLNDVGEDRVRT
jgi:hypothetical protein